MVVFNMWPDNDNQWVFLALFHFVWRYEQIALVTIVKKRCISNKLYIEFIFVFTMLAIQISKNDLKLISKWGYFKLPPPIVFSGFMS